jgi:serine/threonine protein phosphatase PrpC
VAFRLAACGVTAAGPRSSNEDAFFSDSSVGLFIVADGMGGHNAGEVAAAMAVSTVVDLMSRGLERPTAPSLSAAVRSANDAILLAAGARPDCAGMGTTLTALYTRGASAELVNVGDSRCYRLRRGQLLQLTRDDSWVRQLEDEGAPLSADELRRHPMRHVLTEVVGVRPGLSPSAVVHELCPGDVWLLSSDGLHGALSEDQIRSHLDTRWTPDVAARQIVDRAVHGGATDNVTAVVVQVL